MLYLASKSPRRRELLTQIGVPFQLVDIDVPEIIGQSEAPEDYVLRLALEKAQAGAQALQRQSVEAPVLGSDTLGLLDGRVFEKPKDKASAVAMLQALSGRTHQILSAIALVQGDRQEAKLVTTEVTFRELSVPEIEAYWEIGEPQDKAGAYAIQGMGAIFVECIRGSYSGVVGLPLTETAALLKQFGVPLWDSCDG